MNIKKYLNIPYNDDIKYQRAELIYLKSLPKDKIWADNGDNIRQYYYDYLASRNKILSVEQKRTIEMLSKGLIKPIMDLKNHYNRQRPYQLAKKLNMSFKFVPLQSAKTPAYPSGHSTQAVFLANVIADYFPELKNDLKYVANDICFSRLIAGVHFPSDDVFGRYLGTEFYNQFKKNKNG